MCKTSDLLRNDKDIVLEAVRQNSDTLIFASKELRNERNVVMTALLSQSMLSLDEESEFVESIVHFSDLPKFVLFVNSKWKEVCSQLPDFLTFRQKKTERYKTTFVF